MSNHLDCAWEYRPSLEWRRGVVPLPILWEVLKPVLVFSLQTALEDGAGSLHSPTLIKGGPSYDLAFQRSLTFQSSLLVFGLWTLRVLNLSGVGC